MSAAWRGDVHPHPPGGRQTRRHECRHPTRFRSLALARRPCLSLPPRFGSPGRLASARQPSQRSANLFARQAGKACCPTTPHAPLRPSRWSPPPCTTTPPPPPAARSLQIRRPPDEPMMILNPRRARHPLHKSFRTLDAASYADIALVDVERAVLDLAVGGSEGVGGARRGRASSGGMPVVCWGWVLVCWLRGGLVVVVLALDRTVLDGAGGGSRGGWVGGEGAVTRGEVGGWAFGGVGFRVFGAWPCRGRAGPAWVWGRGQGMFVVVSRGAGWGAAAPGGASRLAQLAMGCRAGCTA